MEITFDKREWQFKSITDSNNIILVRPRASARVWACAPLASCETPCPHDCEDGYVYIQIAVDDHRKELCPHFCRDGWVPLEELL